MIWGPCHILHDVDSGVINSQTLTLQTWGKGPAPESTRLPLLVGAASYRADGRTSGYLQGTRTFVWVALSAQENGGLLRRGATPRDELLKAVRPAR